MLVIHADEIVPSWKDSSVAHVAKEIFKQKGLFNTLLHVSCNSFGYMAICHLATIYKILTTVLPSHVFGNVGTLIVNQGNKMVKIGRVNLRVAHLTGLENCLGVGLHDGSFTSKIAQGDMIMN
jgi:hypothetical protein